MVPVINPSDPSSIATFTHNSLSSSSPSLSSLSIPSTSSVPVPTCPSFGSLISSSQLYVPKVVLQKKNSKRHRQLFEDERPPTAHGIDLVTNLSLYRYITTTNGYPCRTLRPYLFLFHTFIKLRWQNREILEVFTTEFGGREPEYFEEAIKRGCIQINNERVDIHYRLQDGDYLVHIVHRHEPSVPTTPIHILHDDSHIIALTKPAGIPVHPCGPHHYLSMLAIAHKELNIDIRNLYPVHRLDRMTSGLILYAKCNDTANRLSQQMKANLVHKRYFALVEGEFPLCPNRSSQNINKYTVRTEELRSHSYGSCPPYISSLKKSPDNEEEENSTTIVWDTVHTKETTESLPTSSSSLTSAVAASVPSTLDAQLFTCFDRTDLVLRVPTLTTATSEVIDTKTSKECPWLRFFLPRIVFSYYHDDEHMLNGEDARNERKRKYNETDDNGPPNKAVTSTVMDSTVSSASTTAATNTIDALDTKEFPNVNKSPTLPASTTLDPSRTIYDPETLGWTKEGYLRVNIALRILDHKNAVYGVSDPTNNAYLPPDASKLHSPDNTHYEQSQALELPQYEKPSVTLFRRIATVTIPSDYTNSSVTNDTVPLIRSHLAGKTVSLIEALPLSGRTHQIRLHCSWIGYPIADDPVYCQHASEAVKMLMENEDQSVLKQKRQQAQKEKELQNSNDENSSRTVDTRETTTTTTASIEETKNDTNILQKLEEACKSICTSCIYGEDVEFTPLQRFINGIALHSAEYQGPSLQSTVDNGPGTINSNSNNPTNPTYEPGVMKTVSRYKRIYANNPRKFREKENKETNTEITEGKMNDANKDGKRNRVDESEPSDNTMTTGNEPRSIEGEGDAIKYLKRKPSSNTVQDDSHSSSVTAEPKEGKDWHYLSPIPVWAGQILDMYSRK